MDLVFGLYDVVFEDVILYEFLLFDLKDWDVDYCVYVWVKVWLLWEMGCDGYVV